MWNKILIAITAFLSFIALMWAKGRGDKEAGRNEAKVEILDDVHQAKIIRDSIDSDPDHADRVRDRFTRK